MAMSQSLAARLYDQSSRGARDLRLFWKEDPQAASAFLIEAAKASVDAPPAVKQLVDRFQDSAEGLDLQQLNAFAKEVPELFKQVGTEIALAKQVAKNNLPTFPGTNTPMSPMTAAAMNPPVTPGTAGVTAVPPRPQIEPANVTGFLVKDPNGVVKLQTTPGTFDVDLSRTDWREEVETAFMNPEKPILITMKGYPSADGKRLFAEQFAPGASPDFMAGRVKVEGDKVFVTQSWNGEKTELTYPPLVQLLKGNAMENYAPAGVIIPGRVTRDPVTGQKVLGGRPEGFFILGRLMTGVLAHRKGSDGEQRQIVAADTGYFKSTALAMEEGTQIPARTAAGGAVFHPTDPTHGSTTSDTGARTFFWVKWPENDVFPQPADFTDLPFHRPPVRALPISWVGEQGDDGVHSMGYSPVSFRFGAAAGFLPASMPYASPKSQTIDPRD